MASINLSVLGKVAGNKIRLGTLVRKKLEDGKFTSEFKMTRKTLSLGDGIEIAEDRPPTKNAVWLNVTREAALRHGWLHADGPTAADLPKLRQIVGNETYGEREQLEALNTIRGIDPELGRALLLAHPYLAQAA